MKIRLSFKLRNLHLLFIFRINIFYLSKSLHINNPSFQLTIKAFNTILECIARTFWVELNPEEHFCPNQKFTRTCTFFFQHPSNFKLVLGLSYLHFFVQIKVNHLLNSNLAFFLICAKDFIDNYSIIYLKVHLLQLLQTNHSVLFLKKLSCFSYLFNCSPF